MYFSISLGELDHPESSVVYLSNLSHNVVDLNFFVNMKSRTGILNNEYA